MTDMVTGLLQVDLKRRTTLPGDILAAAGIPAGSPLVARVEEPGRIVLESPALLLALLQDDIAAALARPSDSTARDGDDGATDSAEGQMDGQLGSAPGPTRDLIAELLADRTADTSLVDERAKNGDERSSTVDLQHQIGDRDNGDDNGGATGDLPAPRDGAA